MNKSPSTVKAAKQTSTALSLVMTAASSISQYSCYISHKQGDTLTTGIIMGCLQWISKTFT